ncbi:unknown [Acidaminococcus sp. CAG:917]|nr:unknown [Acidaminococcus sp. CAG:917]
MGQTVTPFFVFSILAPKDISAFAVAIRSLEEKSPIRRDLPPAIDAKINALCPADLDVGA